MIKWVTKKRIVFDPFAHGLANECLCRGARAKAMQADGSPGLSAAIAEMLLQSHEGELNLLPARLEAWKTGAVSGLFAGALRFEAMGRMGHSRRREFCHESATRAGSFRNRLAGHVSR